MLQATKPCRQLNSEAIKSAALCYLTPVISGRCSIISAKCVCNVKDKVLPKAWSSICKKRDACDSAISGIPNVAFFFSAISTQEKKKATMYEESDDQSDQVTDEELDSSQVPSSTTQQWLDGNLTSVNKSLCPAISYWVALTTPNGAPASPISVHRALLNCGVEVTANQVQFQEGKESPAIKEVYKIFKDHKNKHMQDLVLSSYRHFYEQEARKVIGEDVVNTQDLEDWGKENVVRVTIINPKFQSSLASAIERLVEAKLQIDRFGFTESRIATQPSSRLAQNEEKRFSDKLTILVNDISIAMEKLNYATYRGKVYRKESRARYAFSYKCEARAFVNTLATNEFFKPRLIREMRKVIELIADPYCELFRPLVIDYDLIEVNQGIFWSLKNRSFVKDVIQEEQVGQISPRAFCPYDATQEPDPKYFRQILENSLRPEDQSSFCEDFLKLLNYNKKKHKDKVPCLVGDANSGKTSLFFSYPGPYTPRQRGHGDKTTGIQQVNDHSIHRSDIHR
ncbi:hypothetical protein OS493_035102 [Desmophyllum pertusum]|uniref:Uncharacterized protein n=1 Tax=Desmophyllum pertusum TaxID=174260 RepID=A0A9W9ZA78_9CNID|nr:hypothetical protein OS493_035102 [Desmophyllum pertusum]